MLDPAVRVLCSYCCRPGRQLRWLGEETHPLCLRSCNKQVRIGIEACALAFVGLAWIILD